HDSVPCDSISGHLGPRCCAMKRRFLRLGMAIGCAWAFLPGCDLFHRQGLRSHSDPSTADSTRPANYRGDGSEAPGGENGFFKPTWLSGALSREGEDIERDLGVLSR